MRLPDDAVAPAEAAVLFAVIRQYRPTVRSVAEDTKLSLSYVHRQLLQLRAEGLVAWTEGAAGTLHPTVGLVVRRSFKVTPQA